MNRQMRCTWRHAMLWIVPVLCACAGRVSTRQDANASHAENARIAPTFLLGSFTDDYGGSYRITPDVWEHGARTRYEIVAWYPDSQFLVARNAATNPADAGLWTRIDWMTLPDMAPYTWAFCLSAYQAPTRDIARQTQIADRRVPRTGCNRFPFSRMKSVGRTQP